jgi:NADH dehydrogenase
MIPRCIQGSHFPFRRIDVRPRPFPLGLRFSSASPTPTPSEPSKFLRYGGKAAKYTAFTCFSAVLGLSVVIGGVFIHDIFTYSDRHVDRVPVSPLALHPERGGPKNLPVASELVGDEDEDDSLVPVKDKPRLVIVGGGWGVRPFPSLPPPCSDMVPVRPLACYSPSIPAIIT